MKSKDFRQAVVTGAFIGVALFLAHSCAYASNASANGGHHGGGNNGAVGAAAGAFGGSSSAAAGQGGNGGRYSVVDNYQPWPQSEMKKFQKAEFTPYAGK